MNKPKSILDFFKVEIPEISCPACGISIQKSKLNVHLDSNCSSSVARVINVNKNVHKFSTVTPKLCSDLPKSSKVKDISQKRIKSNLSSCRLSLKQQNKKRNSELNLATNLKCNKDIEIVTIDDEINSSEDLKFGSEVSSLNMSVQHVDEIMTFKLNIPENSLQIPSNNINKTIESADEFSIYPKLCSTIKVQKSESLTGRVANLYDLKLNSFDTNNFTVSAELASKSVSEKLNLPLMSDSNNSSKTLLENCVASDNISKNIKLQSVSYGSLVENEIKHSSINNSDVQALLNDIEGTLETEDNVFIENSSSNQQSENYSPYYIANFKYILNTVLQEESNKILFNNEDLASINAFEISSDPAQKLYVRLFQRKYKWLRHNKINYPNITKDSNSVLNELVKIGLVDLGLEKIDLETALDLLSLPEARTVLKQFNFNSSGKNKADIIQMLLKHCKEHKSVFFTNVKNGISNMMLKKVNQIIGPCYRISLLPKRVFTRILMLFSLPTLSEDDDDAAGGQQQQLLTLLQVNKGEITFPGYKVNRQTPIFLDRDELIRYEEAKQLENDIMNAVENKNFDLAKELYINAMEEFENQLSHNFEQRAASLPSFLKKFTSFHVYVRCMTQGVEILQRMRQYKEAVVLLKRLLNQKVFCQDYHGRWWDRLALNLEQHLKQKEQALEVIKDGLKDENVRVGHRYSLLTRAIRILKSTNEKDVLKNEILELTSILEAPKVTIKGRLFPRNILGRRNIFISSSSTLENEDDITVLGVEELAIEHYKNEGFTEGIHGEGSTFHSLYGLLFWDIIYDGDVPDAFISLYQTHPLDLNHDSFFIRRKSQILEHLEQLKRSNIEEIKAIVKSTWEAHFGQSSLVYWDRFKDVEHILGLISCMNKDLLCGICERLAKDFRFTRSGVPDLVVWNSDTLQVKIVEVKGPGDKLSSKQILWLDYLLRLGAHAEVCHIEAVGSKKLRKE